MQNRARIRTHATPEGDNKAGGGPLEDLYGESIHKLDENEAREVFKHMEQIVAFLSDLVHLR